MKNQLLKALFACSFILLFSNIMRAQDTIFMKNGNKIPAVVVEKAEVEIKYKKFAQPETGGIYTVFKSDVASIHYKNGKIDDFTANQNKQPTDKIPAGPRMKFNIGLSGTYFKRNESDNLLLFWRNKNGDPNLDISGNQRFYSLTLGMGSALDANKRNWFGAALQLTLTPSDAVSASNTYNGFLNEIKLNTFYYDIIMYYGHTLNHKKNLILIFEPGLDFGMMMGYIKIDDNKYNQSTMGAGFHLALGLDWNISNRIEASFRAGERFMKIKEEHEDKAMQSGFSTLLVDPPTNNDVVNVNWSGPYVSLGLSFSLYAKVRSGRPE